MIPKIEEIREEKKKNYPSKTYYINFNTKKIEGFLTDEIEALKQSLLIALNTELHEYPVYKDYGFQFKDLISSEKEYFLAEIEKRITKCIMQDDRVKAVLSVHVDFFNKDSCKVVVKIQSNLNNVIISIEKEV